MTRISSSIVVGACMALLGCSKQASPGEPPASREPAAPNAVEPAAKPSTNAQSHPVLDAYELARAALARDAIAEGIAGAKAIVSAATEAQASAADTLKPKLEAVAKAASAFGAANASDPDAARKAFGEVSRATVAFVDAEPSLKAGRHVFECPMAQGYEKWVQLSDEVNNPYMGSAMLTCGANSTWGP